MSDDVIDKSYGVTSSHGAPLSLGKFRWLAPSEKARNLLQFNKIDESRAALEFFSKHMGAANKDTIQELEPLATGMYLSGDDLDHPDWDNKRIPAAYTYFSQLVSHEINFHPSARLLSRLPPQQQANLRSINLDLDSVYGAGPDAAPYLYDHDDKNRCTYRFSTNPVRLSNERDLPRNRYARALIGDPRNDVHVIVSQLHLAFLLFHNALLDEHTGGCAANLDAFGDVRKQVGWHFQWLVVRDFLPRICGQDIIDELWPETEPSPPKPDKWKFYFLAGNSPSTGAILPAEFSFAAFRFGHAMVRQGYKINTPKMNFGLRIFGGVENLRGFLRLSTNWSVQWNKFVDVHDENGNLTETPQYSRCIRPKLSQSLAHLPPFLTDGRDPKTGTMLALRNLLMSQYFISGQEWAKKLKVPKQEILGEQGGDKDGLWHYILREAEEYRSGLQLGPVGARMVAETIIGILLSDQGSIAHQKSQNGSGAWSPTTNLGKPWRDDCFSLAEFIKIAGLPRTEMCWNRYRYGDVG